MEQLYYIGGVFDEATMTQFRAAVRERVADPSGPRDPLTRAIMAMAAEARQSGMTAEELVISIKREWNEMLDAGVVQHGAEHVAVRDSVVTSAIRAYYVQ
ncbi:MAG: hypothetical protein ACR2GG_03760 [Gemmatimonadaceae bacterium]